MTWLDLLILSLATFRLSLLFSKESGPARIFRKLRHLPPPKSSAREGLACQWCMAVWSGSFVMLLFLVWPNAWTMAFLYMLAVSGAAICWNQQFTKA